MEEDDDVGLSWYRARWYDPETGRFVSEDPIGFEAGDTNLNRYVSNSPVNGTDPSGLEEYSDKQLYEFAKKGWLWRWRNGIRLTAREIKRMEALKERTALIHWIPTSQDLFGMTPGWQQYHNDIEAHRERLRSRFHSQDVIRKEDEIEAGRKYLGEAAKLTFGGDYSGAQVNAAGTTGSVLFGLTGLDAYKDVCDCAYGIQHWEWSWTHAGNMTLNTIALLPLIGAVKNLKHVDNFRYADALSESTALGKGLGTCKTSQLGEVAENGRLTDFSSSAGRIPGPPWKNMAQLRAYLDRQGIGLVEDGAWYLDRFGPNKMAVFDWSRSGPVIFLRPGATRVEVLHEIEHALAYKRLGKSLYESLEAPVRESIASAFVTGRSSFTQRMTFEQLLHEFENMKATIPPEVLEQLKGIL